MRVRTGMPAIAWALACGVFAAGSTQQDPTPTSKENEPVAAWSVIQGEIRGPDPESDGEENRIVFVTPGSESPAMKEMRARLADPEQRKAMRAEQRASVELSVADAEEELKIDATTREALIELLTNQYMESMDTMFADQQRKAWPSTQSIAAAENKKLDQLRGILGDDGLVRYQEYTATAYERSQVKEVDRHLAPADRLSPEQKARLVTLFREKNHPGLLPPPPSRMSNLLRSRDPASPTFQQDMQRESQLATIESNEQMLHFKVAANRRMVESASGFLAPRQLAALAKVNDADVARQRKWIEKSRLKAGLDPAIPEPRDDESSLTRKPAPGQVTLDLVVRVDGGEPVHVTHTGVNGETLKFKASDDLFAEAEWTLYEDNWIDVRLTYFEEGPNGRRRLPGGSGFGTMGRIASNTAPAGNDIGAHNASSTIITGRKAYSVEISASAQAR